MNKETICKLFKKSRFVSVNGENLDENVWRRDKASAIININDYGKETEFGWTKLIVNKDGDIDNMNNWLPIHWRNVRPDESNDNTWNSNVTRHILVNKNIERKVLIRLKK